MDGFAWTVVGSVAGVVGAVAAVIAIVRARADPGGGAGPDRASDVRARGRGLAVGTNTGTVIRARTVHIGTAPPGGAAGHTALPTLGGGDTLPARTPVFTGRAAALADLADKLAGGPVAVVAVRGLGGVGKSQLALEYAC